MAQRVVKTQAELDSAVAAGDVPEIQSNGRFDISKCAKIIVSESSQPHVVAWESSQPRVEAWGSSQPHVVARESSQPRVEAWESSQPRVVARESSQPRVEAWESSQPRVEAWESSQPRVVARGSSQPRVVARGSSQPHVVAWESSQPHVVAWESSQPHVVARGSSQPRVVAWESSQPRVEAWESSQPRVEAWESSQPHVVAWGSSQPHVVAWESSQPRVVARGSSQLQARGPMEVKVSAYAVVTCDSKVRVVEGTNIIKVPDLTDTATWLDYHGIAVEDAHAVLYKGVGPEWQSENYLPDGSLPRYEPGATVEAPDWKATPTCGGGLHLSPTPRHTDAYHDWAEKARYVAVRVALSDLVLVGNPPDKAKVRACEVLHEVDRDGEPVAILSEAEQVAQAGAHPVRSREHEFSGDEQGQYDALKARGRGLYDNLRTQFNWSHDRALAVAKDKHGTKTASHG